MACMGKGHKFKSQHLEASYELYFGQVTSATPTGGAFDMEMHMQMHMDMHMGRLYPNNKNSQAFKTAWHKKNGLTGQL